jgi:hypothetical protein
VPYHYLSALRQTLRGHDIKYGALVPLSMWGTYKPIVLARGDGICASYDRRVLVQCLQEMGCTRFAFGHNHPVNGQIFPSFGDLQECSELGHLAHMYGWTPADFVIVARDGATMSFAAANILGDPLGPGGLGYAKQGLQFAYQCPSQQRGGNA